MLPAFPEILKQNREQWAFSEEEPWKPVANGDASEEVRKAIDEFVGESSDGEPVEKAYSIFKSDDDKKLVFGWASISITADGEQLLDHQEDMIDPEDLEEAVYEYVLNFRDAGEEHIPTMRLKGKLVESCVFTAEKQKAMGIPEGVLPIGWWIGFKIMDDDAWEKVKNGTYKMFSIEGQAVREPIEKANRKFEDFPELSMWAEENMDATEEDIDAAKKYYADKEKAKRNYLLSAPGGGGKFLKTEKKHGIAKTFDEIIGLEKANPYHDELGRFTTGPGGGGGGAVGPNGVTTKEQDAAYMAAVEAGDMETASRMVIEAAKAAGAQTFANPDTPAYSIRRGPEPENTVVTYKTFFVDENGDPSALFVEGSHPLPVGVWLDAKDAYHFEAENGKMYTPSRKNPNSGGSGKTGASIKIPNDQVRQELIEQGFLPEGSEAKNVTALAYRPGWHAGDLPFFPQGGKQGNPKTNESGEPNKRYDPSKPETNYANVHRWNQVVFECEMAADVDYTKSSQIKSGSNKGKVKYTDMQEMPTDGYYKFATNPMTNSQDLGTWYISGSLKINRALSQKECDDILTKNGFKPQEWEGGTMSLDKLNYNPSKTSRGTKLLDPVTYDNNGKVIPLSQRFDSNSDDVRKGDE